MIEVYPNLYVGTEDDYELEVRGSKGWSVVQACKDPYHREALGYIGRSAPNTHPEYLVARRGNRLILNLVDSKEVKYISKPCINAAIQFIEEKLTNTTNKVLVHCNRGQSRSAGIVFLFLLKKGILSKKDFDIAEAEFEDLYYPCLFSMGIREYLKKQF